MTCVIGILDYNKVWLGADRAGTIEENFRVLSLCKVFTKGSTFIIGGRGSARALQLIQYKLKLPKVKSHLGVDMEYMSTLFVDALMVCLRDSDGGIASEGKHNDWLVGYNDQKNKPLLFHIQGDFSVFPIEKYAAIGTGEKIALGALHSSYATLPRPWDEETAKRIERALEAAEYYIGTVRHPFDIISV